MGFWTNGKPVGWSKAIFTTMYQTHVWRWCNVRTSTTVNASVNLQQRNRVLLYLTTNKTNRHTHLGILQGTRLTSVVCKMSSCNNWAQNIFSAYLCGGTSRYKSLGVDKFIQESFNFYSFILLWALLLKLAIILQLQLFVTKKLQDSPLRTRCIMRESMLGLPPLLTMIERRTLIFLRKINHCTILSLPSTLSKDIYFHTIKISRFVNKVSYKLSTVLLTIMNQIRS